MNSGQVQTVEFLSREEVEKRAGDVLKKHGLFSVPVDPVVLANREGIRVHNAKFSDDSLSGMIAKRGENVSLLINQSEPPYRKRFTIAHELGHHFLHLLSDGDFVDSTVDLFRETESDDPEEIQRRRPEIQANQFAAALLMPEELVRREFEKSADPEKLARLFNVSEEAMGYRLSRLGLA